jgi:hypothetical protein
VPEKLPQGSGSGLRSQVPGHTPWGLVGYNSWRHTWMRGRLARPTVLSSGGDTPGFLSEGIVKIRRIEIIRS